MATYSTRSRFSRGNGRARYPKHLAGGSGRRNGPKKDYIHPSRFIKAAKLVDQDDYSPTHQFDDFSIHEKIKQNIAGRGFILPSPIQDQAIPHGLNGQDVIGIANTGTGKTIAFAVPILDRLIRDQAAAALIVAPTRELAQQIDVELRSIGKNSGLYGAVLIGGAAMTPQLRDLRHNPRIVIGTPGRIKDHLERGSLNLRKFNVVVLDEVDRMLDMGFINDVREILSHLSEQRQSYFFSATVDSKVNDLIQTFTNNAITVSVKTGDTCDNVHQDVVPFIESSEKIDKLHNILIKADVQKSIIFDDTQRSVERLAQQLVERGFKADAIHGGKNQSQRQRALKRFKQNEVTVLVATDVAARGIDVADITHVINYSVPKDYQDYIHRIGRAGRAGKVGYALTFVTD
jgi:ATP-dependent RNA helicase RhlE